MAKWLIGHGTYIAVGVIVFLAFSMWRGTLKR
jgi:hypothetical protein